MGWLMVREVIEIKNCVDCRYIEHTGAFTKGGAKPCCGHPNTVKLLGDDCFKRVIIYRTSYDNANRPTRLPKRIPGWCPLRNNERGK